MAFLGDVGRFVAAHTTHPILGADVLRLAKAAETVGTSAQKLMVWTASSDKIGLIPVVATRFLEMMAEVAMSWLLLDAARISIDAQSALPPGHPDHSFYEGKKHAALYYTRNVLPGVHEKSEVFATEDMSALAIPDDAF
jgi:hypothetical protein